MKPSVSFGLVAGVGTIAYLLLCYWIDTELLINPVIRHLTWLPFVICMILPLVLMRRDGSLTFKEGLREAFIVYIIANLCFYVFDYIMLTYVDPSLVDLIAEEFEKAIDQGWIDLEEGDKEKIDHNPTISSYLLTFAQSLIAGFIVAALLALVFRNEK
jgi:hypothetical protein